MLRGRASCPQISRSPRPQRAIVAPSSRRLRRICRGAIARRAVSGRVPVSALLLVALALVVVAAAAAGRHACELSADRRLARRRRDAEARASRIRSSGLKRILSRETLAHSLRASLAFACASAAMAPFILGERLGAACEQRHRWRRGSGGLERRAQRLAFAACAVGLCFAIAEYGAARRAWLRKLRMSFDERKRESERRRRRCRRARPAARAASSLAARRDAAHQRRSVRRRQSRARRRRVGVPHLRRRRPAACWCALPTRRRCAFARLRASHRIPIVENRLARARLYRDGRAGRADSPRALRRGRGGRRGVAAHERRLTRDESREARGLCLRRALAGDRRRF